MHAYWVIQDGLDLFVHSQEVALIESETIDESTAVCVNFQHSLGRSHLLLSACLCLYLVILMANSKSIGSSMLRSGFSRIRLIAAVIQDFGEDSAREYEFVCPSKFEDYLRLVAFSLAIIYLFLFSLCQLCSQQLVEDSILHQEEVDAKAPGEYLDLIEAEGSAHSSDKSQVGHLSGDQVGAEELVEVLE